MIFLPLSPWQLRSMHSYNLWIRTRRAETLFKFLNSVNDYYSPLENTTYKRNLRSCDNSVPKTCLPIGMDFAAFSTPWLHFIFQHKLIYIISRLSQLMTLIENEAPKKERKQVERRCRLAGTISIMKQNFYQYIHLYVYDQAIFKTRKNLIQQEEFRRSCHHLHESGF